MDTTRHSSDKTAISPNGRSHEQQSSAAEHKAWIIDQVTVLAEAFGEDVTAPRYKMYADALADLTRPQLVQAFRRALYELKFFPKVAELRELAGVDAKAVGLAQAEAAWQAVERDLSRRGMNASPALDPRTEYAIRAAGGRRTINACFSASITAEQFTKKAFCEAFNNYDAAKNAGLHELPAAEPEPVRRLLAGNVQRPTPSPQPAG